MKAALQLAEGCKSNLFSSKSLTVSKMEFAFLTDKYILLNPIFSLPNLSRCL
jgi:hypothetical protein